MTAVRSRPPSPVGGRAWLTPQVIVSGLLLLSGLIYFLSSVRSAPGRVEPPGLTVGPSVELSAVEVVLVTVAEDGTEGPVEIDLELPAAPARRLEAILVALRERLVADGVWPEGLGAPTVFVGVEGAPNAAVLAFERDPRVAAEVTAELRLLASIRATVARQGIDRLELLVNGSASGTLLGHVALPGAP